MTTNTPPKCRSGLDISVIDEGYVVYQPECDRVHYLNHSATLILELCTGENPVAGIAGLMQEAYGLPEPPVAMVGETVEKLRAEGLLEIS
jgi:hypothetical protein